jgi:hypothetical protein
VKGVNQKSKRTNKDRQRSQNAARLKMQFTMSIPGKRKTEYNVNLTDVSKITNNYKDGSCPVINVIKD